MNWEKKKVKVGKKRALLCESWRQEDGGSGGSEVLGSDDKWR